MIDYSLFSLFIRFCLYILSISNSILVLFRIKYLIYSINEALPKSKNTVECLVRVRNQFVEIKGKLYDLAYVIDGYIFYIFKFHGLNLLLVKLPLPRRSSFSLRESSLSTLLEPSPLLRALPTTHPSSYTPPNNPHLFKITPNSSLILHRHGSNGD